MLNEIRHRVQSQQILYTVSKVAKILRFDLRSSVGANNIKQLRAFCVSTTHKIYPPRGSETACEIPTSHCVSHKFRHPYHFARSISIITVRVKGIGQWFTNFFLTVRDHYEHAWLVRRSISDVDANSTSVTPRGWSHQMPQALRYLKGISSIRLWLSSLLNREHLSPTCRFPYDVFHQGQRMEVSVVSLLTHWISSHSLLVNGL